MSYATIARCANDYALRDRVTGCYAQEGAENPLQSADAIMWPLSSHSDIEAAYASAIAADNPNPGGDETVITDQMILSTVQATAPVP
jgi:hypothetical protein